MSLYPRSAVPLILLLALTLAGCDEPTRAPSPEAPSPDGRSAVEIKAKQGDVITGLATEAGDTVLRFVVLDGEQRGVDGVEVEFLIVEGSAALSASRDTTASAGADNPGIATTTLRFPKQPGYSRGIARIVGTGITREFVVHSAVYRLALSPDTLRVIPRCGRTVVASMALEPGGGAWDPLAGFGAPSYSTPEPELLYFEQPTRGPGRLVYTRAPGLAHVVASLDHYADTTVVITEAEDDVAVSRFSFGDGMRDHSGIPRFVPTRSEGHTFPATATALDCVFRPASATYASSDPRSLDRRHDGTFAALEPGDVTLTASYRGLSDSIRVHVRAVQALPADTTVHVGDRVTYRMEVRELDGRWTEVANIGVRAHLDVAHYTPVSSTVTAAGPGTTNVTVEDRRQHSALRAVTTLRVLPR